MAPIAILLFHRQTIFRLVTDERGGTYFIDQWGLKWYRPEGGFYFDPMGSPLAEAESIEDIEKFPWPKVNKEKIRRQCEVAKQVHEGTDYFVVFNPGPDNLSGCPMSACEWLMGFEPFFVNLLLEQEMIKYMLGRMIDFQVEYYGTALKEYGRFIDAVVIGDDLGAQTGPLINPEVYREVIKPYHVKLVNKLREIKPDIKIIYHCCGGISDFLPDITEIGYDALNPIHVSADGMGDTSALKEKYGNKITFWGGACDSQNILGVKTPSEVREEVRRRISDLSGNGGFVIASVHNVQRDTPTENIVALYESFKEFSRI
ncbi:MAG: uroporphyrinogen decarboxylase family protein [Acetivibrionales bacterium]